MSLHKFETDFDFIPWASDEQNVDARAYLDKHAPDLVAMVFGEDES